MEWKPWFWLVSRLVYVDDVCGYSAQVVTAWDLARCPSQSAGIKIRDLEALRLCWVCRGLKLTFEELKARFVHHRLCEEKSGAVRLRGGGIEVLFFGVGKSLVQLLWSSLKCGVSQSGRSCRFVLCLSWIVLIVPHKDCCWFWDSIEVEIEWRLVRPVIDIL
ncbi:hypothetical protein Drorol1_Dr00024626, partial [Drosera rotundifolia]